MSSSRSNKKSHNCEMKDDLKWSKQKRNQRVTRPAPVGSPVSSQPQPKHDNVSKSTPAKEKATVSEDKEYKPTGMQISKASTSPVPKPQEKVKDKTCNPKLSITLSLEEIEEDYFIMTGKRLTRNSMKRDRHMQKNLDDLFPALSLEGLNEDLSKMY